MSDNSEDFLVVDGEIVALLPNVTFRVKIINPNAKNDTENDILVLAHTSGKIKKNRVKILVGDIVRMEFSKQDLTKARIVYRYKTERKSHSIKNDSKT